MHTKPTYQEQERELAKIKTQYKRLKLKFDTQLKAPKKSTNKLEPHIDDYFLGDFNRFKQLIKNSFDMILLMDSNGIQQYVSESCEKILGFKQEELMGISVIEKMIHPDDQESTKKDFFDMIENKAHGGAQYRHLHKNGSWVYLEAYGTNQLDNPLIQSVVLNVRDITERKQAEQRIKENDIRLQNLTAAKDKLFSIIAHDLRSPFNAILGFSELLSNNPKDFETDESKKYIEIINSCAKNTLVLLDNLLNWTYSQTGELVYKPENLNLSSVFQDLLETSNSIAKIKNISLRYIQSEAIEIYTDVTMLKIVLRNLINNAIKFTNSNGEIVMYAVRNQSHVEITVSDNGVGINKEICKNLFNISTNITSSGTANEKGSGLGLILCKEFVEKIGGTIWVESEEGKGSDFIVSLPLYKAL